MIIILVTTIFLNIIYYVIFGIPVHNRETMGNPYSRCTDVADDPAPRQVEVAIDAAQNT